MNLPCKPMELSLLFCPSKSEKNKDVRQSERNSKKNEPRIRHRLKNTKQQGVLKLRVKIDKKIRVFSLGETVNWSDWDGKRHRTDYELNLRIDKIKKDYQTLNTLMTVAGIEVSSDSIIQAYKTLKIKKIEPTYDNLVAMNLISPKVARKKAPKLLDLMREHLLYLRTFLSKTTVDNYENSIVYLEEFLGADKDIIADDFKKSRFLVFLDYLKANKKIKDTTIKNNYFNVIKRVYEHYIDREVINESKITTTTFNAKSADDLRHIEPAQIEQLYRHEIVETRPKRKKEMILVKDSYVFSCLTGFHTVEKNKVNSSHLKFIRGSYWLINKRSKTEVTYHVKLSPTALELLLKYAYLAKGSAYIDSIDEIDRYRLGIDSFPRLKSVHINYYLPFISKEVGFELYSSKMGRKSFANDKLNNEGLPPHLVGEYMGVDPKTVGKYGRIDPLLFDDAA